MKPVLLLLAVSALAFGQVPPMIPSAPDGGPVGGAGNLTTVGTVPYVSASGILNQDAGQFFWDATNNRLGIGTATPGGSLEVKSALYGGIAVTTATVSDIISFTLKSTAAGGQDWRLEQGRGGAGILSFFNGSTGGSPLTMLANSNVGISTTTPGSALSVNGRASANLFGSETNCSSSAGPAVCAAAAAGSVIIPAAGTDVVVNTTAVTANSQIFAIFDQSLGTKLGVTCNSTTANPHIGARVAGTSFTIHANVSPVTNPACFSYFIIN